MYEPEVVRGMPILLVLIPPSESPMIGGGGEETFFQKIPGLN